MRHTIDYGIDLGTTNSAIAKIENGVPIIIKSDTLKDTMPSCVHFTNKGIIFVGDRALNELRREYSNSLREFTENQTNTFFAFKRTMGSDHKYFCPNMNRYFTSEELSAEVLKKLKSFTNEDITSIVITHPVTFIGPKIEATKRAAELTGFEYIELLQEPVAASIAYGIQKDAVNGYWLVYDLGGGTFDVSLVKSEEGVPTVVDNAGCDPLGGKDIDLTITDNIIYPYLQERYSIGSIDKNPKKKELLRRFLRIYAEEAKIQLSFQEKYNVLSNLGDLPFKDDKNRELEIDFIITQKEINKFIEPIFQKTIDITLDLLKRNSLSPSSISALLLVGGPTHSPLLKNMIKDQITNQIPTSIDPMTVVAKGAALYAFSRPIPEKFRDTEKWRSKEPNAVKLELRYESCTTELTECVFIRVTNSNNKKYYVEINRSDRSWTSGRKIISDKPELIDIFLLENRPNKFDIRVYDESGREVTCDPNEISILHGIGGIDRMQILPYNIGITVYFPLEEKELFVPIKGLEKGRPIGNGITGVIENLKTKQDIRPGNKNDIIRIPIYQGDFNAEGTEPELNHKIIDVIISGDNLPKFLPKGSPVNITVRVDSSQILSFEAEFPTIEHTEELKIEVKKIKTPTYEELIERAEKIAKELDNEPEIEVECENYKKQIEQCKEDVDGKIRIENELRDLLFRTVEKRRKKELLTIKEQLKYWYYRLESLIDKVKQKGDLDKLGGINIERVKSDIRERVEKVIKNENTRDAKELITQIETLILSIVDKLEGEQLVMYVLKELDQRFNSLRWTDPKKARHLINQGLMEQNTQRKKEITREALSLLLDDYSEFLER